MNTMGCSFLILAAAALVVGFIPILTWINLFIALPLALIGAASAGNKLRDQSAQPADKAIFWLAILLAIAIVLRQITL